VLNDSGVSVSLLSLGGNAANAIAVGYLGTILSSGAAQTWTNQTSGTLADLKAITASEKGFVA
jgi:hypothetical protein